MIVRIDRQGLVLSLSCESSRKVPVSVHLQLEKELDTEHLAYQLIRASHPVFMDCLPEETLEIVLSTAIQEGHEGVMSAISDYATLLTETNAFLLKIRHLKNIACSWNRVLFYRIDGDERFTDLCRDAEAAFPGRVVILDGRSGFDSYERRWKPSAHVAPEILIDHIQSEKAGRVVSTNFYYSSAMLSERHLFIPAIMRYLGVELVSYDVDIYDPLPSGYLRKAVFTDGKARRFSFFPHMQEAWDDIFAIQPVSYTMTYRKAEVAGETVPLASDYKILIMTNSRIDIIRANIFPLLYLLQQTQEDLAFHDFRLWFYAMRKILLEADLPLYVRLRRSSRLYELYVAGLSFFKLETIHGLKTQRPVCLYGDQAWEEIFPEYFQKKYLSQKEKDALFGEGKHLYLLLNENFSYLECHPVIQDAVCRNIPFLTFPPMVRLPEFDGMRCVEYRHGEELSIKAEAVRESLECDAYRQSVLCLQTMWNICGQELVSGIMGDVSEPKHFAAWRQRHDRVFEPLLTDYLSKNEQDLRHAYEVLFEGCKTPFQNEQSRYFDRPYLQALLRRV